MAVHVAIAFYSTVSLTPYKPFDISQHHSTSPTPFTIIQNQHTPFNITNNIHPDHPKSAYTIQHHSISPITDIHHHPKSAQTKNQFCLRIAFHLSGPAGLTSQFLNETHEFPELFLARRVLLMDQSRSVLLLRSAKALEFGELWRGKNVPAHLGPFHLNWPEPVLLGWPERRNGKRPKKNPALQLFADEVKAD